RAGVWNAFRKPFQGIGPQGTIPRIARGGVGSPSRFQRQGVCTEEKTKDTLLDTNVVSAMMLDPPDPAPLRLFDNRAPESIWTTSIRLSKMKPGVKSFPQAR